MGQSEPESNNRITGDSLKLKNWNLTNKYTLVLYSRPGAEMGLVLLVPGTTNNSVNVIQNGLKIIH